MIRVPVTFDKANRKKDRSVSLGFTSNLEINTEDFMQMDRLVLANGWLIFAENEIDVDVVPPEPAGVKEGKPKIQRLRGVAYYLWEKSDQSQPFDTWWDGFFERLLEYYKEKLD